MRQSARALLSLAIVVVGVSSCGARKPPAVTQAGPQSGESGYSLATPNLVPPKLITRATPAYTAGARRAQITGSVELLVRIGADGKPERVRVTKSLDKVHGLDDNAIAAIRRFVFTPATLNGKPVPVDDVPIALSFSLY